AVQVRLGEASFQEGASVDTGCGVALEVDLVAHSAAQLFAAEEVVEAHLVQRCRGCVRGNVTADAHGLVRSGHHDRGIPPDVGPDAALDVLIAGEPGLALGRNRIDVVG